VDAPLGYEAVQTPSGIAYMVDRETVKAHSISTAKLSQEEKDKRKKILPCFWVPNLTPDVGEKKVEKPNNYTVCPEGFHVVRLKQLKVVKFSLAVGGSQSKEEVDKLEKSVSSGRYMCSACRKNLTNSITSACLSPCGHVVCSKCVDNFVKKDQVCTSCGEDCPPQHIIYLQKGGTGFAAHGANTILSKTSPAFQC